MATTDPKETPGRKEWDGTAEATWDIPKAEFTSQKVTRKFAGVRKRFLRIEAGKHRKTQRRFKVTYQDLREAFEALLLTHFDRRQNIMNRP
jgi:hypothetical protein